MWGIGNKIYWGIKTGFNQAFVISGKQRADFIAANSRNAEIIRPLAVGDDVRRWHVRDKDRYLLFTRRGTDMSRHPEVLEYLSQYRENLEPRPRAWKGDKPWPGRKPGSYKWYEIQDEVAYFREFDKPKIIYPDIAKESRFVLDMNGTYVSNTTYFIPTEDYFLLGVLNSKPLWEYCKRTFTVIGDPENGGRLRFFSQDVLNIPIPVVPPKQRREVEELVHKCLTADDGTRSAVEKEIDTLVARLYGLDGTSKP